MTLDDQTHIDWTLLARYFGGVCTSDEAQYVERWVAEEPARAREIALLRAAWEQAGEIPFEHRGPLARDRIMDRVGLGQGMVNKRGLTDPRAPRLTLDQRPRGRWMGIAAGIAAVLVLIASWVVWQRVPSPVLATPARDFATRPAQRLSIDLADGTRVVLGSASRLAVPADFGVHGRTVMLEGDAYFTIAHDGRRPFRVRTATTTTEDLGTSLVIRARSSDSVVEVMVVEGKVALHADTSSASRGVALSRGQLGRVARSGLVSVTEAVDISTLLGWMEGKLDFHKTPLAQVCEAFERWYDVRIELPDSTLRSVPVTASFSDQSVDEAFRTLAQLLGLRYERNGSVARLLVRSTKGGTAK